MFNASKWKDCNARNRTTLQMANAQLIQWGSLMHTFWQIDTNVILHPRQWPIPGVNDHQQSVTAGDRVGSDGNMSTVKETSVNTTQHIIIITITTISVCCWQLTQCSVNCVWDKSCASEECLYSNNAMCNSLVTAPQPVSLLSVNSTTAGSSLGSPVINCLAHCTHSISS